MIFNGIYEQVINKAIDSLTCPKTYNTSQVLFTNSQLIRIKAHEMFFPEIAGNECMKFLQNVVFTTDTKFYHLHLYFMT